MVYRRRDRKGWWFTYRDEEKRQHQKYGGKTKRAALEVERELILDERAASTVDLKVFVMNQYWPAQKAHLTPRGMEREQGILNNHLGPYFEGPMSEINRPKILSYTNKRLAEVSRDSVRKELGILKHILRIAVKLSLLLRNPFDDLEAKDWPARGEERTRHLTPEEWNRLLFFLPESKRAAAIILVNTGLRRGELFSLKWSDLDFQNKIGYLKTTKSRKPRWFILTAEVIEALKSVPTVTGNPKIFCIYSPTALSNSMYKAAIKAGLHDFRLHDLRHTFATSIRKKGIGIDLIQNLLGHADLRQTRRYAHLGDEQLEEAARSIENVFTVQPYDPEKKGRVH